MLYLTKFIKHSALAGLVAAFIAVLTVNFQSVKAALSNPVDALRSE